MAENGLSPLKMATDEDLGSAEAVPLYSTDSVREYASILYVLMAPLCNWDLSSKWAQAELHSLLRPTLSAAKSSTRTETYRRWREAYELTQDDKGRYYVSHRKLKETESFKIDHDGNSTPSHPPHFHCPAFVFLTSFTLKHRPLF